MRTVGVGAKKKVDAAYLELQKEIEELKKENKQLKEENKKLSKDVSAVKQAETKV